MQGDEAARRTSAQAAGGARRVAADAGPGALAPLFPQLTPRRNASPEAVAAHQRARLHAATIEACRRHGYRASTAREVAALAGVSKKALYKHFASKQDCFLQTYDLVVRQAAARIVAAYRAAPDGENWSAGLCRAFEAFAAELVRRPAQSHLALVDVLAVGPEAVERIERAEDIFAAMIRRSFARAPDDLAIPPQLVRALIGGVWFIARNRLQSGEALSLADEAAELLRWMLTYRTAAAIPIAPPVPGRAAEPSALGVGAQEHRLDERTRLLRAAAVLVGRGGFAALSELEVTALAGTHPESFARHFDGPAQCFQAVLDYVAAAALARALRESAGAPDWGRGVFRAIHALYVQIAADRQFAHAAFLDAVDGDPVGAERRAAVLRGFAEAFVRHAPGGVRPSRLVAEAIVGSIWSLAQRRVARGQAAALPRLGPYAAFLALAPVLGAPAALAVIEAELANPPVLLNNN